MTVRAFQHHERRATGLMRFDPSTQTQAPLVTRCQARKLPLWARRREVIALLLTKLEKISRHNGTDQMRPDIRIFRATTTIPHESG